ncbi:NAD(P)/FAD-dependent oxidoreductase [Labedella endophytica]|uniref:NAD(P)/FAD-dependent oxidoreductase n=1 Tax=Labedella endophytica TaxID=1523160 RepID=A0A433JNU9_9MICO|nr:NAD(P)/FAD-dependent oxidoreductase [Labedella endophytica]RUQ97620.1 NAD(P)/FAD-dependent oxidoreductase [Labedella endophytica]
MSDWDVVVVGGGPAGLSAALNLVRARLRVLVLDSNRPRHSATLVSHGFLTRDGIAPHELRALGRAEVDGYDEAQVAFALVTSIERDDDGFRVRATGVRGAPDQDVTATHVLVTSGLAETLPDVTNMRAYYGTSLHSCLTCDGYEKAGEALAVIGETDDLADVAWRTLQWTDDVVVFTNGAGVDAVSETDREDLEAAGVRVEHAPIVSLDGDRSGLTGVTLDTGETVPRSGGFVRPRWEATLAYLEPIGTELARDDLGLVRTDAVGRTSVPGLYAAGDVTPPGPQQLVVAAGHAAAVAGGILTDVTAARRRASMPENAGLV